MVADRGRIVSKRFEWFALPISRTNFAFVTDDFRAISKSHKIAPQSRHLCRERGAKFYSFVSVGVKVVVIFADGQIHKLVVNAIHYAVSAEVVVGLPDVLKVVPYIYRHIAFARIFVPKFYHLIAEHCLHTFRHCVDALGYAAEESEDRTNQPDNGANDAQKR